MSLINDALKRARESQRPPPPGAPPLPPVELPARGGNGWMLALALILFLAAVCLLVGVTLLKRPAPPVATTAAPTISTPRSPVPPVSVPAPVPVPVSASNIPAALPGTNPPPAAPVEPLPKVQGIVFDPVNPEAIVNGKTISVGKRVGNFQVKEILENSVVFQRPDGSEETIKIGE